MTRRIVAAQAIRERGWSLRRADGAPVYMGDRAETFRGELVVIQGGAPPHTEGATGYVYCSPPNSRVEHQWYPSVVDCKWVREAPADEGHSEQG